MTDVPFTRSGRQALAAALALLLAAGACTEDARSPLDEKVGPTSDPARPSIQRLSTLIVSNSLASATTAGWRMSHGASASGAEVAFVSLPPGSVPNGEVATIRMRRTQAQATAQMTEGGFDPVPIAAAAGDTLDISIQLAEGSTLEYYAIVPPDNPPVIVRTDPPPMKHDVPLNVFMRVVFSEPIDPATLTASSVQLLLDGELVAGTLGFEDGLNLTATFTPAGPLVPESDYSLVVTRDIEDLDGDALAAEFRAGFATAAESITVQAVRGWSPITFEMNPYFSYRWWTGPDASSGACPMNGCPARRLTVSRISDPAAVVLEFIAATEDGFDGVIGGHVPPGVVVTASEWVSPTTESVRYMVTVTLLDGRTQSAEFDSYVAPAALPAADIAFVSNRDGTTAIYVASADGSGVTRVTEGLSPAWSPDGSKLVFFRNETRAGPAGIYVLDRASSGLAYVGPGSWPTWSPDGRIAFHDDDGIGVMNADGTGAVKLLSNARLCPSNAECGDEYRALAPTWSPDGRSVAFFAIGPDAGMRTRVGIVDVDGSDPREFRLLPELEFINSAAVWSPDGSRIAVIRIPSRIPWHHPDYPYEFYTYDIATTAWHLMHTAPGLGFGGAPVPSGWSPDGRRMLVSAHSGEGVYPYLHRRIYVVSLVSGAVEQLIPDAIDPIVNDYSDWGAVWSPGTRNP